MYCSHQYLSTIRLVITYRLTQKKVLPRPL